jgi:hypothetical protein
MKQVFNDCLGKTKQQIFDYCVLNNIGVDTIFAVGEKADSEIPNLERKLMELNVSYVYEEETGGWYAPFNVRCESDELENKIDNLIALRDNAEEVYSMLDDYYYERQTF